MSDLKPADIQELMRFIRKKTKKVLGYVWDFNDLTFREFVNGATGCNIDDKKYKTNGTSKEKRLREFLTIEENSKVKLLLEELLDYGTRRKFLLSTHIKNMEFAYVYLLRCNKKIEEYTFEDDEVSEVKYVLYKDLEKMVEEKAEGILIHKEEFEKLFQYIRSL